MKYIFFIPILIAAFSINAYSQKDSITISKAACYLPAQTTVNCMLGDRSVAVLVLQYGEPNGIVCINVHDNEDASVKAAQAVLQQTGGTLIKIKNNRQRNIRFTINGHCYSFDPNRIFSRTGIEQTLRDNRRICMKAIEETNNFAQRFLALIPDSASCIVALHNNSDGAYSVESYLEGGSRQKDAKKVYENNQQDADDICFTTDSLIYHEMANAGYNSILQDNECARKDGSLSIHFGEQCRRYINIETQAGKDGQYKEMFEKLVAILANENKNSAIR